MRFGWVLGLGLLLACGDDDAAPAADAGTVRDAGEECARVCDDGVFCNGTERCRPSDPEADDDGCVAGEAPCAGACDEEARTCEGGCPDADGDGAASAECGGTDCDDDDATRFPGAVEICDAANVDEDCDPSTFGDTDADDDGFVDAACCNGDTCGDDCDDGNASAHPGEAESCDGADNDCDAATDEGVLEEFYPDADDDLYGDMSATAVMACEAPDDHVSDAADCDDGDGATHPTADEVCDGVRNDCTDGVVDEGCATGLVPEGSVERLDWGPTDPETDDIRFDLECPAGELLVGFTGSVDDGISTVSGFPRSCGEVSAGVSTYVPLCAPVTLELVDDEWVPRRGAITALVDEDDLCVRVPYRIECPGDLVAVGFRMERRYPLWTRPGGGGNAVGRMYPRELELTCQQLGAAGDPGDFDVVEGDEEASPVARGTVTDSRQRSPDEVSDRCRDGWAMVGVEADGGSTGLPEDPQAHVAMQPLCRRVAVSLVGS